MKILIPNEWIPCPNSPEKIFEFGNLTHNQLIEIEFADGELRLIAADDFVLYWAYVRRYRVYMNAYVETERTK